MTIAWRGLIEKYRNRLPVTDTTPVITLGEGNTPLLYACELSERMSASVWLKFDGANPTGSFKDRGMTMAISKAVEEEATAVVCASTGNTSAAAAAYAAKAGLKCIVLIPDGKIALGKLAQAVMHGAQVIQIDGNFDQALEIVRQIGQQSEIAVVNSINPYRIQGQKTAAFEIVDALGDAPDIHCIPVGNAGNITAYHLGYREYATEISTKVPRMYGFQAAGAAPLVLGHDVDNPDTIATAIRIGRPASADGARAAVTQTNGAIRAVTDQQILDAYRFLAASEGVFCEPSSAASVAGLLVHGLPTDLANTTPTVVCTLTGHGLKDPATALGEIEAGRIASTSRVAADYESIRKLIDA